MASSRCKSFVGLVAASSLFVASTGAVAETRAAPIHQLSSLAAVAGMSSTVQESEPCNAATAVDPNNPSAADVRSDCTPPVSNVAPPSVTDVAPPPVAQPPPTPVPVPPVEPFNEGLGISPLLLGIGAILLGAGVYLLVKKGGNSSDSSTGGQ